MAIIDNLTATWNSGGTTFSALKMNVTDSASAAASMLLNLLVGGVEKFAVTKAGDVRVNTDKFTVAGASGNTAIAGDVAVATDKLTVAAATGNTAIAGTLAVTGAATLTGAVAAASSVKSAHATAGIGYATGAGGAQTQGTSKATTVTSNTICGAITMHAAELAAGATVGFQLTNSAIAATDVVIVSIKSGGTNSSYRTQVAAVGAGSCRIELTNTTGGALSEAVVLNFTVIKAVAA
jgi:hypothetical protein